MSDIELKLMEYDNLIRQLAHTNPVHGYEPEDLAQEFRMVFLKCYEKYDETKKIKFDTYFITSCKNRVKNIKAKIYAGRRPLIELSLNRINQETGLELINYFQDNTVDDRLESLAQDIVDTLEAMDFGYITMDYFFEEMTFEQLAEKYDMSLSKVYREHKENLQILRKMYQN